MIPLSVGNLSGRHQQRRGTPSADEGPSRTMLNGMGRQEQGLQLPSTTGTVSGVGHRLKCLSLLAAASHER